MKTKYLLHRTYLRIKYLFWWYTVVILWNRTKSLLRKVDLLKPDTGPWDVPLIRLIRKPNIQVCTYCYNDNFVDKIEEEHPYCMRCGGIYKYELGDGFKEGAREEHNKACSFAFDLPLEEDCLFKLNDKRDE